MRASIYNAMPEEGGVEKLVEFMKKFEAEASANAYGLPDRKDYEERAL